MKTIENLEKELEIVKSLLDQNISEYTKFKDLTAEHIEQYESNIKKLANEVIKVERKIREIS